MRYHRFILTLWQEVESTTNGSAQWRYSLEHAQTGQRHGFNSSDELLHFVRQWTSRGPPDYPIRNDSAQYG